MDEQEARQQEARRHALRAELADLTSELRQWAEFAADTGADALPFDDSPKVKPIALRRQQAAQPHPQAPGASPHEAPGAGRRPGGARPPASRPRTRPPGPPGPGASPLGPGTGSEALDAIRRELGECTRCRLHEGRTNLVFGVGNPHAEVVIVGEGPGYHEDRTGEPFVGRAGQLLTRMLAAIGVRREDAYICNVIKCRPPKNRDPQVDEIATCSPFMRRQLEAIGPKAVITVGRFAGNVLLDAQESVGRLRGRVHTSGPFPVVPTYHPAYLLRNPAHKARAWEDLLLVKDLLRR